MRLPASRVCRSCARLRKLRAATQVSRRSSCRPRAQIFSRAISGGSAEAYRRWALRHLQLTHYRPNELGDIQTEPAVHGGLTAFGAGLSRQCNPLGHRCRCRARLETREEGGGDHGPNRSCSHTSLTERPAAWTRQSCPITPVRLRPPAASSASGRSLPIFQHRGLCRRHGEWPILSASIMSASAPTCSGWSAASALPGYADLPQLAAAGHDLAPPKRKILGGNYRRCSTPACVA